MMLPTISRASPIDFEYFFFDCGYMRCRQCSEVRGYPYKRGHLVALRTTKITASDPPSTWWPGER